MKRKRKRKNITLLLLMMGTGSLYAQEAVPATGGEAIGDGGTVSYTVGQIVYTTNSGENGSVRQGVQQVYEISTDVGLELEEIILLSTYPNPTTDFLTIKIEDYDYENLTYQLYDIQGSLVAENLISNNETTVNMNDLVPATYFLNIRNSEETIKVFKIVKK